MNANITAVIAEERVADLRRAAGRPPTCRSLGAERAPRVELRLAENDDAGIVRRLAALDDARELEGRVLLALIDGDLVAALSLDDGRVVANPFVATAQTVTLIRLRAEHLSGVQPHRRRIRLPRLRSA